VLDIETISRAKKEVHGDMSYAIVRNEKLTRAEINGKGTHNDKQKIILIKILIQQEHI
jgi:hypothetical protein